MGMFTPLMFADVGLLILILLILAFVVAMFCLMLVGLGVLIAFPLTLIRPLFGKKAKWDKDLFIASLALTPVVAFLGILGIELLKIFGEATLELIDRVPFVGHILLLVLSVIVAVPLSHLFTRKKQKESDDMARRIKQAEKDYDYTMVFRLEDEKAKFDKDLEKTREWISAGLLLVFLIVGFVLYMIS